MNRRAFIFIPGILQTPQTVDSWADHAVYWVNEFVENAVGDRYEYRSGATTRWWGQAARVKACEYLLKRYSTRQITIGAHSNGCEIALRMLRECSDLHVRSLHLFAPAADACFEQNGLNKAIYEARVGEVHIYGSHHDRALWAGRLSRTLFGWAGLGYGDLGRAGPANQSDIAKRVSTMNWRDDFGHSTWFDNDHFHDTMRLITEQKGA